MTRLRESNLAIDLMLNVTKLVSSGEYRENWINQRRDRISNAIYHTGYLTIIFGSMIAGYLEFNSLAKDMSKREIPKVEFEQNQINTNDHFYYYP